MSFCRRKRSWLERVVEWERTCSVRLPPGTQKLLTIFMLSNVCPSCIDPRVYIDLFALFFLRDVVFMLYQMLVLAGYSSALSPILLNFRASILQPFRESIFSAIAALMTEVEKHNTCAFEDFSMLPLGSYARRNDGG